MDELFKTISSDAEMVTLLKSQGEEFFFLSCTFEADIDIYDIIAAHPIPGITSLNRKTMTPKPEILKRLNPSFDCSCLQFDKPVSFLNCTFKISADFTNVVFNQGVSFRSSTFEAGMNLNNVKALGLSAFGFTSMQSVIIMKSTFTMADQMYTANNIDADFHVENSTFNSGLNLNRCNIKGQLSLNDVKFNGRLALAASHIGSFHIGSLRNSNAVAELKELDMSEAEFQGQVQFTNLNFTGIVRSRSAIFNESVYLTNVSFRSDTYLNHTTFHKSFIMENVTVLKNLSFYGAVLNSKINLTDIDFTNANLSFTGAHINADLWVGKLLHQEAMNFNGTLNFEGALIDSSSIVRITNLNHAQSALGKINLQNTLIKGLLDIRNVFVEEIRFGGTVVTGNIQDDNSLQTSVKDRYTARLLKHEAKRINNMISSVAYNKLELELYAKNIKFRQTSDWLILKFNYWSNSYGTNWLKGVWFTFYTGLTFYFFFFICANKLSYSWADSANFILLRGEFWSGFINYFWLPYGFKELASDHGVAGHLPGAFFFITGKILIAYGIYQIIAAFRKYL